MSRQINSRDEAVTTPVLLYDANCTMCNELAYKVRDRANEPLRLVALSDPEADELLAPHYADDWDEDFYFINGGTARKGKRALPSIMKTVGVRDFTALMGDYLQHHQNQGGDCDHEHEGADAGSGFSRRKFVGTAAAVGTALFANPTHAKEYNGRPPGKLAVRVARVSPDGNGEFDVTIEREDDLVRQEQWKPPAKGKAKNPSARKKDSVSMESIGTETLVNQDTFRMEREDVNLKARAEDAELDRALDMDATESEGARMTRYGVLDDRERYGFSLNFAEGPMTVDGEGRIDSTLSGRISHDVPRKTVDFIKFESESAADLEAHLEGYVAGLNAYQRHYADNNDRKMAGIYREIAERLSERASSIPAGVDGEFEPVQNVLSISSVPYWTEYVESPTTDSSDVYQASDVSGTGCDCSCCSLGCCTGCDCGCSICIGTPKPGCGCGCCIGGCGAGCGCGCCYCVD